MNPRTDWYTAILRAEWEANLCTFSSYGCGKNQDFESALPHEMTHALSLRHPGQVDQHNGQASTGGTAYQAANCGNPVIAVTSCPGG